jgi:phosphatidylglycerophosphatase C
MTKKNKITLFDLDKTLITCDSIKILVFYLLCRDFYKFSFKIPSLIIVSIRHLLSNSDHKTDTKSQFFAIILKNYSKDEIKKFSSEFAAYIFLKFKNLKIYRELLKANKKGIETYIITASADFYCKSLAKLFGTKLISTKINLNKDLGKIIGKNCYGIEKKKRALKEIKKFKKKYSTFYTDCISDKPLMNICSKSYFVK